MNARKFLGIRCKAGLVKVGSIVVIYEATLDKTILVRVLTLGADTFGYDVRNELPRSARYSEIINILPSNVLPSFCMG